jgi:hypothetical protein
MINQEIAEKQARCHKNVMEDLVYDEIARQIKHYPKNLAGYINKVEVATYALNRLPALYASSQNGQSQQIQVARKKYKDHVVSAVRRAIAAIERDPLRVSAPIVSELENHYDLSKTLLNQLQTLLQQRNLLDYPNQEVTLENAVAILQKAFNKMEWSTANQFPFPVPPPPPLPQQFQKTQHTQNETEAQRRREETRNMGTLW